MRPFVLPYLAAVSRIIEANLTVNESVAMLAAYNLGYALPFTIVRVLVLAMGDRARPPGTRETQKLPIMAQAGRSDTGKILCE